MSNELTVAEAQSLSITLAKSKTLPALLQSAPADVLATILAGQELGFAPMMALRAIKLIQGNPTLSAEAMSALCQRSPACEYLRCVETSATKAVFETKRKGHPDKIDFTFTMEQANRAGISGGVNWKKYPDAMLRARAVSGICKMVYPDVVLGVYLEEELQQSKKAADEDEKDVTPPAVGQVAIQQNPVSTTLPTMEKMKMAREKHEWRAAEEFAHEDLPPGTNLVTGEVVEDTSAQDAMVKVLDVLGDAPSSNEVTSPVVLLAGPHKGKSISTPTLNALRIEAKRPANGPIFEEIEEEIKRREAKE